MDYLFKALYLLLKGIIIAVTSAWFISLYDIASLFPFVEPNRAFVVSNIIYIAILSFVFNLIEDTYSKGCTVYEAFFSPDKDKRDSQETPTIIFTKDYANFNIDISLEGKENSFKDKKLIVYFPDWVTIQPDLKQKYLLEVQNNTLLIDISKLFNTKNKKRNKATCKIGVSLLLKQNVSNISRVVNLDVDGGCKISKFLFLKLKTNKIKIKVP